MNVPVVSYTRKPEEIAPLLQGSDPPHLGAAGRRAGRARHGRAVARSRVLRRAVHGRGLPESQRRRGSARAVPHRLARIFLALGVPIIAGRDFNEGDRRDGEKVVIVSQSLAQRMFPNMDAVNRRLMWTDPVTKFIGVSTGPAAHRRRRRRRGRRERRAEPGDDGVSPDGAGDRTAAACSCTRRWIRIALVPRDHEDHSRVSPRISRWSAPRRWTTCARRCWRRIA